MDLEEKLNCERCGEFTDWYLDEDNKNVVRCENCDKRHSRNSIYSIDSNKEYKRNQQGELLEDV